MTTPTPDPAAHLSQIVRYSLQLPTMVEPDSLATVRTLLMEHQLVVDRVVPGEALVASATGSDPDWQTIKIALKEAGYPIEHTTTVDDWTGEQFLRLGASFEDLVRRAPPKFKKSS